jgi:hypothetical protein
MKYAVKICILSFKSKVIREMQRVAGLAALALWGRGSQLRKKRNEYVN